MKRKEHMKGSKPIKKVTKEFKKTQLAFLKQMVKLATSGFGLVAALAWNNVIKEFVEVYVKKYLPDGSGFLSLVIYAIIVTALAVTITLQLTKLTEKLEEKP